MLLTTSLRKINALCIFIALIFSSTCIGTTPGVASLKAMTRGTYPTLTSYQDLCQVIDSFGNGDFEYSITLEEMGKITDLFIVIMHAFPLAQPYLDTGFAKEEYRAALKDLYTLKTEISNLRRIHPIDLLLEAVADIADIECPKRVWIQKEDAEDDDGDNPYWWFWMVGNSIIEKHAEYKITELQCQLLTKLMDELKVFVENNDSSEGLSDSPKWTRIMELAKDVLEAFNYCNPELKTIDN